MLLALLRSQPGLRRAAALVLLSAALLFAVGLFGSQITSPQRFGCAFFGEDFITLYASSKLVLTGRGAAVYDLNLLDEAGAFLLQETRGGCSFAWPMEYWLAFLVPFLPLTIFPPRSAYYIWTTFTLAMFLFGLWRLAKVSRVPLWSFCLIALGFYPTLSGLLQGQVHGWQFLALVEFWLALRQEAQRSAGFWLSLQLVKPQFVPLLLLYLVWRRRWPVLGWFTVAALCSLALTVFLSGGVSGVTAYVRMISHGIGSPTASIGVWHMVNWRALAFLWFGSGGPDLVGALTVALTLVSAVLVVWSWHRRPAAATSLEPQAFLLLMTAALLTGYQTFPYTFVLLLVPALLSLAELAKAPTAVPRFWPSLLDFTLISPSLFTALGFALAFKQVTLLWLLGAQALLLGSIGIFLVGIYALVVMKQPSESATARVAESRA